MSITILLVDDHENVRVGLRKMLARAPEVEVVGEAGNGLEALELAAKLDPDVLLLDVEMPGMKGYEVARRLTEIESNARILALSGYNEKQYILGMFANGAVGYLTKDEAPGHLLSAVKDIAAGRKGWISAKVAERLGIPERGIGLDTMPALNKVERQILQHILKGKTDDQMMTNLHLGANELAEKIQTLSQKLGVKSRPEAVLRAMQEGLL